MALWGFGSGCALLNPAPAGWHRGEREVMAPQHTAHKTLKTESGGDERQKRPHIHTSLGLQAITLRA